MTYKKIPNKYNLIKRAMENDGYRDFRYTNQHGLICMGKLIEGWSIFTEIDNNGYKNRFCYHTERGASANFLEWQENGFRGEPRGYHTSLTEPKVTQVWENNFYVL